MKTTFKLLFPVLLVILLVAAAAEDKPKPPGRIATIDLMRAFDKYYRHEQAMKAIEREQADIESKLKSMQDEGQRLVDDRAKLIKDMSDPMITSQEKETLRSKVDTKNVEIESKRNEIRTYQQHAVEQLDIENKRVNEQIVKEIRAAVDAKARAAGFALVVDASALVYSNGENDITDEILKQINAAAPTAAPAEAPKSTNSPGKK